MSGSDYPPVFAHRMLLDVDGTSGYRLIPMDDGTVMRPEMDYTDIITLNNEDPDGLPSTTEVSQYLIAFPELRIIDGLYLGFTQGAPAEWIDVKVEGSADTRTGVDGTWVVLSPTSRVQDVDGGGTPISGQWNHIATGDYRRYVQPVSYPVPIRCIRIVVTPKTWHTTSWTLHAVHLYGRTGPGENPDRVAIWDPVLDQPINPASLDWGTVFLGSSADVKFRVKNLSTTSKVFSVELYIDALTDTDPSVAWQHYLSYRNSPYSSSVTITELAPGARSDIVTLRRVTPSDAAPGPWAVRLRTISGGFTGSF